MSSLTLLTFTLAVTSLKVMARPADDDMSALKQAINDALENNPEKFVRSMHPSACTAPKVAFTAKLTNQENYNLGQEQTVKYENVVENLNNNYNSATGMFFTSEPGVYMFNLHALSGHRKTASLYIAKNGERVTSLYADDQQGYSSASTSAVVHLKTGDTVYVVSERGGDGHQLYQNSARGNSFSGVLLTSDICHN